MKRYTNKRAATWRKGGVDRAIRDFAKLEADPRCNDSTGCDRDGCSQTAAPAVFDPESMVNACCPACLAILRDATGEQ